MKEGGEGKEAVEKDGSSDARSEDKPTPDMSRARSGELLNTSDFFNLSC